MFRPALLAAMSVAGPAAAQTRDVELNGHTFTLPKGFTIELAAGADLAPRPIAAAFDTQGRLYVTDSSGSNEKVQVQLEKKPHRVLRLEDTNGDGRFDKQTVFVKNVMLPQGAMWLGGSLYVAAPPHILKFTDTDDDGVADKEEVWFDGKTLTGCANDLHGPYPGPDGRIYWTKGAFAAQEYTVNGKKWTTRAAHVFRATPDGKNVEPVMTGGMDNPVDVVFTPGGDLIFSTTFFQHPAGGKRDGLVHAVYGGVYGKDHPPAREHPLTGPELLPPLTHLGPAAPCGLHRYESDQFGPEYADNLFCCQFNLRKVSRHVLVPKGSTYETRDSDFVVSDNLDFHPTDVIEDADGSLLVVDTGGWYKLCCPTSQLVKPDVTGAIYRVRKDGAHKVADPRGLRIDWGKAGGDLPKLLDDPRPEVRRRAARQVRGSPHAFRTVVLALAQGRSEGAVCRALWTAAPHPGDELTALFTALLDDDRAAVRATALRALALLRRPTPPGAAARRLADPSPHVRRAAAELVGRDPGLGAVLPELFAALADEKNDRELDHALTYALIELGRAGASECLPQIRAGLRHASPRVRRAALAALSHLPGGLEPRAVVAELDAKDAALGETAWWVAGRNPQWAAHVGQYLRDRAKQLPSLSAAERDEFGRRLAPFLKDAGVRAVVGDALLVNENPGPPPALLRAVARSGLKALPDEWATGVRIALNSPTPEVVREAVAVLRAVPPSAAQHAKILAEVTEHRDRSRAPLPPELAHALRAAAPPNTPLSDDDAKGVIRDVHTDSPGAVRAAAADLLGRAKLGPDALDRLAAALGTANPLELPKLLAAFERSADEAVGLALVRALRSAKLRPVARVEVVKPILDKYPPAVRAEAEKLYAELAEARKDERARLEKVLADLKPGDVRRGQVVFNSAKASCVACHKVGYVGGTAGPDLTKIGGVRSERDLLEAILYPSASFVRSYEPVRVVTTDDRVLNGVLRAESADEVVVAVAADREERVSRADIASMTPSAVSLMPGGLDQQLTPQELADLLAFLRACR